VTKIAKLYSAVAANPGASFAFRDFEALLRAFGFVHERTKGSHRQYGHPRIPRVFTVLPDGKHAKRYQVREFLDMVDEFGLDIDE